MLKSWAVTHFCAFPVHEQKITAGKYHMSSRCSGSTLIPCLGGTQRRTLSTKTSAQGQAHDGAASEMARGGFVHKDLREGMG